MSDRLDMWRLGGRAMARMGAVLGDLLLLALGWACMALGAASAVPADLWLQAWEMLP